MIKILVASFALLFAANAWAHDGPYSEWCEETEVGGVACTPASEWFGKWEICSKDSSGTAIIPCHRGWLFTVYEYEEICLEETSRQLDANSLIHWKQGDSLIHSQIECSEDPVSTQWPQDPRDPCIQPALWWSNNCTDKIQEWLAR